MRHALLALALVSVALAGCSAPPPAGDGAPPPAAEPAPGFNPIVRFRTDMGDFFIEVFEEMVPVTAGNFLDYARSRFYEGIKVHRVLPGFVIQMGDPNTRDLMKGRDTWGTGDPGLERIPDEFHAGLLHDTAGVVSMANSGPDTGTSQFFITLAPQRALNDRHAVFGQVVQGMDVVNAVAAVPTTSAGPATDIPVEDIVIRSTEVLEAQREAADVRHGLSAWTYFPALNTTPNHTIQFAVVVRNTGTVRELVEVNVTAPEGWRAFVPCPGDKRRPDCPIDRLVGAGTAQFVIVQLRTPLNIRFGDERVVVRLASPDAAAEAALGVHVGTLGERPGPGDVVVLEYVGYLRDGRVFDTSRFEVIRNESVPKKQLAGLRSTDPADYQPLEFEVGQQRVVPGFEQAALELRVGETGAALLPPALAYGPTFEGHQLAGHWLLFDMELLAIRG